MNKKFTSSSSEYLSTIKSFAVDHDLVITKWDGLLDASTAVYLFQPFKHHLRYWKLVTFLENLLISLFSVYLRRAHSPSEQLGALMVILITFQALHLLFLPYIVSRERKLDAFCRLVNIWNCGLGILIAEGMLDNLFAGVLLIWGNLGILMVFGTVMQVPQLIKILFKGMRSRVDAGVVQFLFGQIERKKLALEFSHTGLHLRYWKLVTFLENLLISLFSVYLRRAHSPSEQLGALMVILITFQALHLLFLPYIVSRERKLDAFCRLVNIWNCGLGILIAEGMLDNLFAGVLLIWGNLGILMVFGTVMQVPQLIKILFKGMRSRVDAGVVQFLFGQIERKKLALEFSHTGLTTLQQWDNILQDQKWNGVVGFGTKTKPTNLLTSRERMAHVRWAALRNLTLINVRDSTGVSILHEAMAKAEPEGERASEL